MKKRTKITLRTKIYLTIVGLLALTGVLYASNPAPFSSSVPFPTGVAAVAGSFARDRILQPRIIDKVDCNGNASLFATIRGLVPAVKNTWLSLQFSPRQAGFTPRDVFVTQGALIYKSIGRCRHAVCDAPGCLASDHNGITFDHFGTFGFDMIVTCRERQRL